MPARKLRAQETRQRILDSAAAVFTEKGFSQASLNDIAERAYVTTGAFYYHFESKDAVATALTEESWPETLEMIAGILDSPAPGLENVIVMTFAVMDMMSRDRSHWLAFDLDYRFGQDNDSGRLSYSDRVGILAEHVTNALARTELHEDTTPQQAGAAIVSHCYGLMATALHGSAMVGGADPGEPVRQLADNWGILLRGIAPTESLGCYRQFLARTAAQYERRAEAV